MKPRRLEMVAVGLFAGWVLAWLAYGSAGIEDAAASVVDRHAAFRTAATEFADVPHTSEMGIVPVVDADLAAATDGLVTGTTTDAKAGPELVVAALTDPSQTLLPEISPARAAIGSTLGPEPGDVKEAIGSSEVSDECLFPEICIDRYLWSLYQRAPKRDTIKEHEQRKVKVRKKGKMVTVTKTFTRLVDEDFAWKDPKAAEKAGMAMMDYVIGGMDPGFKLKLFHTLHAAEAVGLSPGITSAFRDDYRQSIASGLKAATNRSYHGGSFRGGYGHGLAADIVSVKGATRAERWVSTETLWKWIDAHGEEYGIGRPYLDRDPPHVAPTDGKEYTDRRGTKPQQAGSDLKKRDRVAARD